MPVRLKKLVLAVAVAATLAMAAAPHLSARGAEPVVSIAANNPYSPTEVLVRFRPGVSAGSMAQSLAAEGVQARTDPLLAKLGYTVVTVPAGQVVDTLTALGQNPDVEKAEPNYIRTIADGGLAERYDADRSVADTIPTDPAWGNQYGPVNIQMPALWDTLTGTAAITIAILDTGVDLVHPDLAARIWTNPGETGLDGGSNDKRTNGVDDDGNGYVDDWRGWDFANNDNNPQDEHFLSHGTHVAGIAGAVGNNGVGIAGVNWAAPLMVVRVLGANGSGTDAQVAAGIVWATDQGAKIINLSLGGAGGAAVLEDAVNYAYNHGALVVAAAGNIPNLLDTDVLYPAAYANALAVASTDSDNVRANNSRYGPEVDLSAPGVDILSTIRGPGYGYLSGTSMATPHVAGVAAILAGRPQFNTPDKIRVALESTALDVDTPGWDQRTGYGVIQAWDAALFDADTATPTPIPVPPTPTPQPMGYALASSDTCPAGVTYTWESATGGTNLNLTADDGAAAITLPFAFSFNGQARTAALVSTNGYLTFGSSGTTFSNAAIPNPNAPDDFIAPFWDDLDLRAQGTVYSQTVGSAPDRRLIIEWHNVKRYSLGGETSALTFQAVLFEGTDKVQFQYQALTSSVPANATGASATVGLEYANGTAGAQYSHNTAGSLHAGLALLFAPDSQPAPNCAAPPTATPLMRTFFPIIGN